MDISGLHRDNELYVQLCPKAAKIHYARRPSDGRGLACALAQGWQQAVVRTPKVQVIVGPQDQCLATRLQNYLADFLGDNQALDWKCSTIKINDLAQLQGITAYQSDCLVVIGHPAAMNAKALELIYDYWQRGGSIVGIRIVDFALQDSPGLANEIFGGEYQCEHLLVQVEIHPSPPARRHPLLSGIRPFILPGGVHRYEVFANQATPVLFASAAGEIVPVAWARSRLGRRVFATSLGSAADFRHPYFLRLLANAILWASR